MNEVVQNGEIVFVFTGFASPSERDDTKYIKGKVISSQQSDDLSYHGSSWYVQIYKVLLENGQTVTCTEGSPYSFISNHFFRTAENYLHVINYDVSENNKKISELKKYNQALLEVANEIIKKDKQDIKKRKLEK